MEDKLIDNLIKEELKDNNVPDIFNDKVNEALFNISKGNLDECIREDKKGNKFRGIKIAIMFLCLIGGTGVIYNKEIVSYAKEAIVTVFKYMNGERRMSKDFDEYSNKVMAEAEDKNINVKITDVISDGVSLKLGYTVENNNLKSKEEKYEIAPLGNRSNNLFYINGKEMALDSGWANTDNLSNKVTIISESHRFKDKLPEKFDLEWKITRINEVEGNWNLKFTVDSNELMKESKIVKVNKSYTLGEIKYHIKEVRYTPISNFIDITGEADESYYIGKRGEENIKGLLVTDEEGVVIQEESGMYSKLQEGKRVTTYTLDSPIEKCPKKINIVPYTKDMGRKYVGEKLELEKVHKITIDME